MTQAELGRRDARIIARFRAGSLETELAGEYGLTQGRISQIIRARGLCGQDGGAAKREGISVSVGEAAETVRRNV